MPRDYSVTKKRNQRAKALLKFQKRQAVLSEIENSTEYVPEDSHIEYFNK